jgi:8-oxo-dGTP diphosphatase
VRPVQRVAAYALLRPGAVAAAADDAVVLVQASRRSDLAGRWFLPGGGVDHGEHPDATVVREVREETGLDVRVTRVREVLTDVIDLPHRDVQVHTVRLLYDVEVVGGRLRAEPDGSSDALAVLPPWEASRLWLAPYVARALGLPEVPLGPVEPDVSALEPLSGVGGPAQDGDPTPGTPGTPGASGALRRLRVGTYGVARTVADGVEHLLLARLADHVSGRGRWSLPGGGLDHGEDVDAGLRREVHEETGLDVTTSRLLGVSSTHFTGRAPDGTLEDFHGVRLVHRVDVGAGDPRVVEVGGSTAEARWVPRHQLAELPVVGLVRDALTLLDADTAPTIER